MICLNLLLRRLVTPFLYILQQETPFHCQSGDPGEMSKLHRLWLFAIQKLKVNLPDSSALLIVDVHSCHSPETNAMDFLNSIALHLSNNAGAARELKVKEHTCRHLDKVVASLLKILGYK